MEKNNEKQLPIKSNCWLRPLVKTKLWMFLIFFLISCFSTGTVFSKEVLSGNKKSKETTLPDIQQQHTVTGTVTDASTGETLSGVTVLVKGTTIGVMSDPNGKFSLNMPGNTGVLVISFVGYQTQEINATEGSALNIKMSLEIQQVQEVVVVGYGVQKKESVVGAITQVESAVLSKTGTQNITNAISGRLSGVLTIQQTGQPGNDASEIVIRGLSSWQGSQPLVLIDGVERDFSALDPEQINTISVLKDASATAVFGAKGANGVIIVTTKRGAIGKPQLSFSTQTGIQRATRLPDHISSYTTMNMLNVAFKNEAMYSTLVPKSSLDQYLHPSSPLMALQYPDDNWFSLLMKPYAPTSNANISMQGGTEFIKYFCSLAYLYEGDYFKSGAYSGTSTKGTNYSRYNYRANFDFNLTKTTQLSVNLGGIYGIQNTAASAPWGNMYFSSVARFPAYFPSWVLQEVPDTDYPGATGDRLADALGDYSGNPYTQMNSGGFTQTTQSTLNTDLILTQKLDFFLKGLSFKGSASLSTNFSNTSLSSSYSLPTYYITWANVGVDANGDGKIDNNPWFRVGQGNEVYTQPKMSVSVGGLGGDYYRNLYYELSLNYSNTFFKKHNVTALVLMNRSQKNTGTDFPYYNEAWVGRVTYDYSHKYLVEINVGYTGSAEFAPSNRFGFFPSGALGWVVSDEPFFTNAVPWMSKLKFRYSDGLVGSDLASSRWLYKSDYALSSGYIMEAPGANTSASWEEARKRDFGIETGLFRNLFTFSLDLFDEQRDKMLLTPQNVTFMVGNTFKDLNLGSLKKHGFEMELEFNKTTSSKLNYFVKGNFGFNENRIINKNDLPYAPDYSKAAGKPLGAQVNGVELTGTGYYTSVDDIHNNVAPVTPDKVVLGDYKFLDYNADGAITTLDKHPIEGNTYPPITYSVSSGFTYRGFDFNFMFQGNYGKWVEYYGSYDIEFRRNVYRVNLSQLDYWTPSNQDAGHPTLHYSASSSPMLNWGGGESDHYSIDILNHYWRVSNYLRLKQIYLGYNIKTPARFAGISNILVYATANNVLTFTSLIEGDPERKSFSDGYYPNFATYNLGLKFSF